MSNTYTIVDVRDSARNWQTQKGAEMRSYRVKLRNKDGRELDNVEVARVAHAPKPEAGQTLEGTVDTSGQYGPKFKEARQGAGGGGFRSKPPEERRSIAMQSSCVRGVELVRIAVEHGVWKPETTADLQEAALAFADKFYERVQKAEAGA